MVRIADTLMTNFTRKKSLKNKLDEGLIGQHVHTKVRYRPISKKLTWFQRLLKKCKINMFS